MPVIGVTTRVIATAYKAVQRFPGLLTRQVGATGTATPLPDGGLVTYNNGTITFDPLAPRNALDGNPLSVAGIKETGTPYIDFTGVPDDLAADTMIVQRSEGRVLRFMPRGGAQ